MAKPDLRDVFRGSLTGEYMPLDGPTTRRRLVVLTWGTSELLNGEIALLGMERSIDAIETFTDENGAAYFKGDGPLPTVIPGRISNRLLGPRPGTRGILRGIKEQIGEVAERPPLEIVTHARLAGRAALESWQEGFDPILRPGMPARIIKNKQIWTSSKSAWNIYDPAVITLGLVTHSVKRTYSRHAG